MLACMKTLVDCPNRIWFRERIGLYLLVKLDRRTQSGPRFLCSFAFGHFGSLFDLDCWFILNLISAMSQNALLGGRGRSSVYIFLSFRSR